MAADQGTFELHDRGSDLVVVVAGDGAGACLAACVAGLAASLATVPQGLGRRAVPLRLEAADVDGLLVDLVDAVVLRLDAHGELAVGLTDVVVSGDADTGRRLRGTLEVVDLARVDVHGVAPKAATWHGLRLAPCPRGGWTGQVMVDL